MCNNDPDNIDKFKYICVQCKTLSTAESLEKITAYRKLCGSCLSNKNKKAAVRSSTVNKTTKVKSNNNIIRMWKCVSCGVSHRTMFKPTKCGIFNCNSESFTMIEKNKVF